MWMYDRFTLLHSRLYMRGLIDMHLCVQVFKSRQALYEWCLCYSNDIPHAAVWLNNSFQKQHCKDKGTQLSAPVFT